MSIRSKAKRDARKKKTKSVGRRAPTRSLVEHAHLIDGDGAIFGGAGLRGQEWIIVLGGRELAGTDSAAMALAMLNRIATVEEAGGTSVRLSYSTQMRDAATAEATAEGKTLDEYLAQLEAERAERADADADADAQELGSDEEAADSRPV